MSRIAEKIKDIEKRAKRTRLINTVLIVGLLAFVVSTFVLFDKNEKAKEKLSATNVELENQKDALNESNSELKQTLDRLGKLVAENEKNWADAVTSNTLEDYKDYLESNNSDDPHFIEAYNTLNKLLTKTGFVQILETNGNKLFDTYEKFASDEKFLVATGDRNVRIGVIGNPEYSPSDRNGDVVLKNHIIKIIIPEITSGGTKWAKIKYAN